MTTADYRQPHHKAVHTCEENVPPATFTSECIVLFPHIASALILLENVINDVLPEVGVDLLGEFLVRAFFSGVFLYSHKSVFRHTP